MSGFRAVAALRFREALAGRMLWLLPLHFAVALVVVRTLSGPTLEARLQAADATALALAAVLGLVAAAVMGASPLAAERLRPRGALVLSAPVSAAARVLGTALGSGGALLLLVLGLSASAMAVVDLGVGGAAERPRAFVRASTLRDGTPDPRDPSLLWLTRSTPSATAIFDQAREGPLLIDARPASGAGTAMPGSKKAEFVGIGFAAPRASGISRDSGELRDVLERNTVHGTAALHAPFRIPGRPGGTRIVTIRREAGNFDLGIRKEDVRIEIGVRSRILARGLHAAALLGGLLAAMGAAMALSTIAGAGVAAGGALALALLSLFRTLFLEAADTLAQAGAMERAMQVTLHPGEIAIAQTGTPPAFAPLFRALATVLPDGTGFDLASVVAANEVPDPGDVGRALLLGLGLCVLFLGFAVLGARRRP